MQAHTQAVTASEFAKRYAFTEPNEEVVQWRAEMQDAWKKEYGLSLKLDAYCGEPAERLAIENQLREARRILRDVENKLN